MLSLPAAGRFDGKPVFLHGLYRSRLFGLDALRLNSHTRTSAKRCGSLAS